MQTRYIHRTAVVQALAFVLSIATAPNRSLAVTPLDDRPRSAQQVINVWKQAGAKLRWNRVGRPPWSHVVEPVEEEKGNLRVFALPAWNAASVGRLPEPPFPFGLDLTRCRMTNSGLKPLARFKELRGLWLPERDESAITDAGLKELANLPNLEELDVHFNRIIGWGLKNLAGLKKLRVLNLSSTQLTDAGMKCVPTAPTWTVPRRLPGRGPCMRVALASAPGVFPSDWG